MKKVKLIGLLVLLAPLASCNNNKNKNVDDLFFTINGNNLQVTFCDRGASIYSIKYNNQFVTYHPQDKNTFIENNYYGKCLGRVAGRIPDGNLRIGDKEYNLEINETKGGKNNCIHGGSNGLNTKDWTHEIVEKNDYYQVTFKYLSSAGESGFPETLNVRYIYKVSKTDGRLDLTIDAGSSGLTPADLSIHPFFRLGDSGTVLDHKLTINAENLGKYDSDGHQTVAGITKLESNSPWNFKSGKNIGKDIQKAKELDSVSGGYDHIWYFGNNTTESARSCKLEIANDVTKIKLNVESSDSDAVIMYANCYPVAGQKMNNGEEDTQYAAITIEPYTFFTTEQQSMEKLFINKDKSFSRHISYIFSNIE